MFKSTIIAIMLFMMSLNAGAAFPVMTYADFVHLSDAQKDEYIVKLMELTVELEGRYKKETAKYGYSQERFERYSKVLRTLKSIFLIDSAYAGESPSRMSSANWDGIAKTFGDLMNSRRSTDTGKLDENCIFAGWVSRVRYIKLAGQEGLQPTCSHPDFINGTGPDRDAKKGMAPESRQYPNPQGVSSCPKDNKDWIQCNPVVFGYKSKDAKTLFCVETSDMGKNSSLNCMKLALSEQEVKDPNDPKKNVDSKETRLKDLRGRLAANPQAFQTVWEFTYKTCICPSVAESTDRNGKKNKFFSEAYQNHIRPHRTCFGLMDMMGATALECTSDVKFPIKDTKIFSDLRNIIKRESISEDDKDSRLAADKSYGDFVANVQKERSEEYLRVCEGIQPTEKKDYKCSAKCDPDPADAKKQICKYSLTLDDKAVELEKEADGPQPKDGETSVSVKFKLKSGQEESVACAIPQKEVPKDSPKTMTCKGECKTDKDGKIVDCKYSFSDGTDATFTTKTVTPSAELKAEDTGKQVEVKYLLEGENQQEATIKCDMTIAPKEEEKKDDPKTLTCSGDCKSETKDGKTTLTCTYKLSDGTDQEVKSSAITATKEVKPEDKEVEVSFKREGSENEEKLACKLTMPKKTTPTPVKGPINPMNFQGGPQMPQMQIRGTSDTSAVGIK